MCYFCVVASRNSQDAECRLRTSYYFPLVCVCPQPASRKMQNARCGANWINFVLFCVPASCKLRNAGCGTINKLSNFVLISHPAKLILTVLFLFTLIWRSLLFFANYKYDSFDLRLKLTHKNSLAPAFAGCMIRVWKMKYQMKCFPQSASCRFAGCGMLKQSKQKFIILHSKFGLLCHNDMGSVVLTTRPHIVMLEAILFKSLHQVTPVNCFKISK